MPTPLKLPAEVGEIIHHSEGVKSFILNPLKRCPNFKPGQFLQLAMDDYDPSFHWPESRVFSIASSPTRRESLRVTFSVKGDFTDRMYNDVKRGDTVWLKLPYGSFSLPDNGTEIVLVAGGTGITPFVSFLEYAIDKNINTKINLYYGIRNPDYLIFESLIKECEYKLNQFRSHIYLEQDSNKCGLSGVKDGILSIETILNENNNPEAIFYLSGPQLMIESFREKLIHGKVKSERIIIDKWD